MIISSVTAVVEMVFPAFFFIIQKTRCLLMLQSDNVVIYQMIRYSIENRQNSRLLFPLKFICFQENKMKLRHFPGVEEAAFSA